MTLERTTGTVNQDGTQILEGECWIYTLAGG
jgi:hypothetical protein